MRCSGSWRGCGDFAVTAVAGAPLMDNCADMAVEDLAADPRWRSSRRIIAVLLLISPIDQIGFDLYAPALPIMGDEFAVANDVVQNTVTAYLLGMTLVVLPAGLISDAFGRKRLLLSGLCLVIVTGFGCAM